MDTRTAVQKRIFELCQENRIAINKLAHLSGISPSTLKNIVYGRSKNPGVVTIKYLCDGLGITLAEFFDTDDFTGLKTKPTPKEKK